MITNIDLAEKFNTVTILRKGSKVVRIEQRWRSVYVTRGRRAAGKVTFNPTTVLRFNAKCVARKRMNRRIDAMLPNGYRVVVAA